MPIQTATLEQCVSGLKRTIDSQAAIIERQGQQLQDARAWAALWKRAAKLYHRMFHYIDKELRGPYAVILKAENQRQAAEIERLREALLEITQVHRTTDNSYQGEGKARDMAAIALSEANHDAR